MMKQITEPSRVRGELAWILGVMCGDGCLENHGRTHRISLNTTQKEFGKEFVNNINKIFHLKEKFNERIVTNNNNSRYYKIQIGGQQLCSFFLKIGKFGCFKWRVPLDIINGNKKIKQGFLRGFYDSEGSINTYREKYKKIRAVSVNKKGLKEVSNLLKDNGINVNLIKEKNCYSLNIYKKNHIGAFLRNIGFSFKNIG